MVSLLYYLPFMHDADEVGVADGGQPVGYDERRTVAHQVLQSFLHQSLGLRIERRSGFVKNENRRILEYGACDREALPLPA